MWKHLPSTLTSALRDERLCSTSRVLSLVCSSAVIWSKWGTASPPFHYKHYIHGCMLFICVINFQFSFKVYIRWCSFFNHAAHIWSDEIKLAKNSYCMLLWVYLPRLCGPEAIMIVWRKKNGIKQQQQSFSTLTQQAELHRVTATFYCVTPMLWLFSEP